MIEHDALPVMSDLGFILADSNIITVVFFDF